ncbi:MAG: type II secretion system protein [Thiovulaceae bacterium]|nr:type II secretion system protein [Sulfurimonadaceae bacterium]
MKTLRKKAFTMIELIFVVVVLGILTSIALPKFATTQNEAAEANIKQQIQAIRASIESEKMERLQKAKSMQNNDADGNLTLCYNYRPWLGETYQTAQANGTCSLIMQDVDTFQYKAVGDLIKVQMCVKDGNISSDGGYSICKEKTIF